MTLVLCLGCLVLFAISVVFRFANLAHGLAQVGWLPNSCKRWLYGIKR